MASITRFFYDWNVDYNGFIWPGNIIKGTTRPYVAEDFTDNDNINNVDETALDIIFNEGVSVPGSSGDNLLHEDTYLRMQHFDAAYKNYETQKLFWLVYPGIYDMDQLNYLDGIKTGSWLSEDAKRKSNSKQKIYIYDVGQKQIIGVNRTNNEIADYAACNLENLRYSANAGWFFSINGKAYSLFSFSLNAFLADCADIGSLAVWSDKDALMMLLPNNNPSTLNFEWTTIYYNRPDLTQPYAANEDWTAVGLHDDEVVAMFATVPEADHINLYTAGADGVVTSVNYYKFRQKIGTHEVWVRNVGDLWPASSNGTVDDVLDAALADETKTWMTPTEFYNKQSTTTADIKTGDSGYAKAASADDEKQTIPIWFWVNTLANWCTFKHGERHCTKLCVWNGRNGWDSLDDILRPLSESQTVMGRYYYDITRFILGTKIFSKIYYNGCKYQYKSVKLPYDSRFSQYDETDFQCIKIGRVRLDDKGTQRYPFTTGIPPIMRLPSGELTLIYYLVLPGMTKKNEVIYQDQIDFINSVCQAYFGKGDEKTIYDDWKRFYRLKDTVEETAASIVTDDVSSLVDANEINTIHEDAALLNVTMSIPRQYPETISVESAGYVEDWRQ